MKEIKVVVELFAVIATENEDFGAYNDHGVARAGRRHVFS